MHIQITQDRLHLGDRFASKCGYTALLPGTFIGQNRAMSENAFKQRGVTTLQMNRQVLWGVLSEFVTKGLRSSRALQLGSNPAQRVLAGCGAGLRCLRRGQMRHEQSAQPFSGNDERAGIRVSDSILAHWGTPSLACSATGFLMSPSEPRSLEWFCRYE